MERDEGYARRALRLLDEEPDWPSLVDIDRAIADGRRRERRNAALRVGATTVAVGLVVGGLAGAVAPPHAGGPGLAAVPSSGVAAHDPSTAASVAEQAPPAPTGCAVHLLPAPEGFRSAVVMGADPTGRYLVGTSVDAGGRYHALLWTDGVPRLLDPTGTDTTIDGIAVNSSGIVAWSGGQPAGDGYTFHVYLYREGKVSRVDAAQGSVVIHVNPAGDILTLDGGAPRAKPGSGPQRLLSVPAGAPATLREVQRVESLRAAVLAVDDDGTAVGLAAGGSGPLDYGDSHAAVWRDGTMTVLNPPDAGYAARPTATADGWIGGLSWPAASPAPNYLPDELGTGVRWNLRTGAAEPVPGVRDIKGINRYGWTVGTTEDSHPVAALGDRVLALPLPAGADPIGSAAATVSDDGRTIGGLVVVNDRPTAVRWTCD
jgi:hypothetical protein